MERIRLARFIAGAVALGAIAGVVALRAIEPAADEEGHSASPQQASHSPEGPNASGVPAAAATWCDRFSRFLDEPRLDAAFYDEVFDAADEAVPALLGVLENLAPVVRYAELGPAFEEPSEELNARADALLLLGLILGHPRTPADVRAATVEAVAHWIETPLPSALSPEASEQALHEKAEAFGAVARADRRRAASAWQRIPDAALRRALAEAATRMLVGAGMSRANALALMADVQGS